MGKILAMTIAAIPISDRTPPRALRGFAWGVLGYFIATTILWGAVVRATGSGAGCGDHWPLCNGTVLQQSPTIQTVIEFTHRVTAALDLIFVVGLLVWTWRRTVSGHLARWSAAASIFFTLTEGLIGALLVKLGLTAQSHSPLRAPMLALHLSNTLLLVAALAMTAHLLGRHLGFRWRDIHISECANRDDDRHDRGDGGRRHWIDGGVGGHTLSRDNSGRLHCAGFVC